MQHIQTIQSLNTQAQKELEHNILPFWDNALDTQFGGIYAGLDRTGKVIDRDKSVWLQGRYVWTLCTMYTNGNPNKSYLEKAQKTLGFLENHCFDSDGRMFFRMTQEGQGLIKRKRYLFSECFTVMAYSAYSRATGNTEYLTKAKNLLWIIEQYAITPGLLEPKVNPAVRSTKGLAFPMIMLVVLQELRMADLTNAHVYNKKINGVIQELQQFTFYTEGAVLEQILQDGTMLDTFEGRTMNPGHAIEAAWFILKEAQFQNNREYKKLGLDMLGWMWDRGWDTQYGGFYYFRDIQGHPSHEYWHDMKFWWPHNEAVIAALYAFEHTNDEAWLNKALKTLEYCNTHFSDPEFGEWFGYLHRDGSLSSDLKGTYFKGPFHVPRMYMMIEEITTRMLSNGK